MRLLIVANGFPPTALGGVEVYCSEIARGLQSRGHQVFVFCRESDPARQDYSLLRADEDGIPVVRLVNDFKHPGSFQASYKDPQVDAIFSQIVDEFRPDLVHYNHWIALSAGLPAVTWRRAIPSVLSLHDYWPICHRVTMVTADMHNCPDRRTPSDCYRCVFQQPGRHSRRFFLVRLLKPLLSLERRIRLTRRLGLPADMNVLVRATPRDFEERARDFAQAFQQVDQVLTPSAFLRDILRDNGFAMPNAQVLPLGIGVQPFVRQHPPAGQIRFAFIGTLLQTKGIETLVRAFQAVSDENIRLEIYGREDVQPHFSRHVRTLASGDRRIAFHGSFLPDQRAVIYAGIDVLVIPSVFHETFSFVAREALLAGVPVVAAQVGALTEIIHEGINGFLYPAMQESALSEVITRIARQPDLLLTLRLPGPVEILTPGEHIQRLEQIYRFVASRKAIAVK